MTTAFPQDEVLAFWFGAPPHEERACWFRKDPAFDAEIRSRFGESIETALGGGWPDVGTTPHGSLALVLLLDQFTRNAFRDTPRAFAGDARALDKYERWFLYMPFEHAEDRAAQERAVALFRALAAETGEPGNLEWAEKHAAVVRRFGRFPHRNAILGRVSTPEEIAFLQEQGSRF
jgi:uncharacterized protein (DUF924 family)